MIGIQIHTNTGHINIVTAYSPPREQYLHYPDFYKTFTSNTPTYFLGDLNARHTLFGYNNTNRKGEQLITLINRRHAIHLGLHFSTLQQTDLQQNQI